MDIKRENVKNIILPRANPLSKTYPKDANILSVLQLHEESIPWLLNSFIALTSYDNLFLDYYDFYYRNCPIVEVQRIKIDLIKQKYGNLVDFLIQAIVAGFYPYCLVQTRYIPAYQNDKVHDMFIFGVDCEKEIFYIADYFQGKYEESTCTFIEMEKATFFPEQNWEQGFRNCIELLSYTPDKRCHMELWRIKESLINYLFSKPTERWYVNHAMWTQEETERRTFGINSAYKTIYKHLQLAMDGEPISGSNQAFYLLYEHKAIMLKRLQYMKQFGIHMNENNIVEYKKLTQQCQQLLYMKLKYDIKNDKQLLDRMLKAYVETENIEKNCLEQIISDLDKA